MADFPARHIGPDEADEAAMLRALGVGTLDELAAETVPNDIRFGGTLDLPAPVDEAAVLAEPGRALAIDCRGKTVGAEIVSGPFYKRGKR